MENGSLPFGGTNASVAQLVVQRTCNAKVEGSSPFSGTIYSSTTQRSVAQPGSAPALGAGGRRFESYYSDQFYRGDHYAIVDFVKE